MTLKGLLVEPGTDRRRRSKAPANKNAHAANVGE